MLEYAIEALAPGERGIEINPSAREWAQHLVDWARWYMPDTERTGEYIVVLRTRLGRVGYRDLKESCRIRVEPKTTGEPEPRALSWSAHDRRPCAKENGPPRITRPFAESGSGSWCGGRPVFAIPKAARPEHASENARASEFHFHLWERHHAKSWKINFVETIKASGFLSVPHKYCGTKAVQSDSFTGILI